MIFGNVSHLEKSGFPDAAVQECFAYAEEHDLRTFPAGVHEIDGKR